jgi:hypothetical protein
MIAHIAGAPLEELLVPLMSSCGALVVAVRLAVDSYRDRRRRQPRERGRGAGP